MNDGIYHEKLEKVKSVHVLTGLVKLFFRFLCILAVIVAQLELLQRIVQPTCPVEYYEGTDRDKAG